MTRSSLFGTALFFVAFALSSPAAADAAQERAARTFEEGQRAFAAGSYRQAAVLFEEAYLASPHPATLFNAAKARARGGDSARAATLYARIEAESPSPRDREDARAAREALLPKIGRVQVTGEFDQASVDGASVSAAGPSYVEPGEHVVTGELRGRTLRSVVQVGAGAAVEVKLSEATTTVAPPPRTTPAPLTRPPDPHEPPRYGLPRVLFFVAGGATLVAGGLATWSGFHTLAQKDRFDRTGADADLDEGLSRQARTNVLFGVTLGLAVATGVMALFTDWRPRVREEVGSGGSRPF